MTPRHLLEPSRLAGGALLRTQSDGRLVDMTRAGNDRAFEAIVGRYKGILLRYCSRILPDGRAEDAVQQVFVNAYRALQSDTTPLALRSWLFGIAHNVSLNVLRQRGREHEPLEAASLTEEPAHITLERRERLRQVLAAVAALPAGQRDALLLRELEGRGHEEIARELGITGGAARQLISRARNGIRSAAAAIVPMPLIMRLTADTAQSASAERIAELTTVGGGGITVTKVVATGAIGATLLGGAVTGPGLVEGDGDHRGANVAEAAPPGGVDKAPGTSNDATALRRDDGAASGPREERESGPAEPGDDRDNESSGPGDGDGDDDDGAGGDDDSSGPGPGDDDNPDDNSGPGSGDDSEPDNSGPGSGTDDLIRTDNSGPGSIDDSPDSSGPGGGEPDSGAILEPDDTMSDSGSSDSGSDSSNSGPGSTG